MAAFGVFGLCQIHAFVDYLRSKLNAQQFEVLFKSVISLVGVVLLSVGAVLMLTGKSVVKLFSFSCPCCETDESADTDQLCIILREDFSMDRAFLLSAGSVLCQEQHPHHCLSLWAPAHHLVLILLWPSAAGLHVSRQVYISGGWAHTWWSHTLYSGRWWQHELSCCKTVTRQTHCRWSTTSGRYCDGDLVTHTTR